MVCSSYGKSTVVVLITFYVIIDKIALRGRRRGIQTFSPGKG